MRCIYRWHYLNYSKKAIRDLQSMQGKLNEHLDEMDQYAKTKGKNVCVFRCIDCREIC